LSPSQNTNTTQERIISALSDVVSLNLSGFAEDVAEEVEEDAGSVTVEFGAASVELTKTR
jgi:hypothetical protein